VIGDALRARRQRQHRTLREVSTAANVSLGYLSEIERGEKEASSELLAAVCEALGSQLSEVLRDASDSLARAERSTALVPEAPMAEPALPTARLPIADGEVAVSVRRNGPLRTTLHTVRTRPPTRPAGRSVVRSS
jgi:XRE family transcriptional regulator, stress-response regulator